MDNGTKGENGEMLLLDDVPKTFVRHGALFGRSHSPLSSPVSNRRHNSNDKLPMSQTYVRECDSPEFPENEHDALLKDSEKAASRSNKFICFNTDDLEDTMV